MIDGTRIRLRDWSESDLPDLTGWRNDAALQAQLLARVRGSSIDQVRRWAQARSVGPSSLLQLIALRDDDRAIGYVQVVGVDELDQCGVLGICVDPTSQGTGFGREALAMLIAHGARLRPLRKLELRVLADNARAIRCYEAVGFTHCGVLRQCTFIDGAHRDVVLMERFLPGRATEAAPCAS